MSWIEKKAVMPAALMQRPVSAPMAQALAALQHHGMERFRIGYAPTFRGPFVLPGTMEGLWKRGLVRWADVRGNFAYITPKGLQWLADWREQRRDEAAA